MRSYDIIIVGAGPSGLAAALSASQYSKSILIVEKNNALGKKITATGNGKCNFTNLNMSQNDYYSIPDSFYRIIENFKPSDIIRFFSNLGIPCYERNGYCYPYSCQASSVQKALVNAVISKGVTIMSDTEITGLEHNSNGFILNSSLACKKLILATGGLAQPCFGNSETGFRLVKSCGHKVTKLYPGLTGIVSDHKYLKTLQGVRHEAQVKLISNTQELYSEYGEIIFNKTGISGIPVMNLSHIALKNLGEKKNVFISLDFFPNMSDNELFQMICDRYSMGIFGIEDSLCGVLNNKLIYSMLLEAGFKTEEKYTKACSKKLHVLCELMKNYCVPVSQPSGYENAQVTSGGVSLSEIDPLTMESKICAQLYFCGEITDVNAKCGGYNLHYAFASGLLAGANAAGGQFDKNQFLKIKY